MDAIDILIHGIDGKGGVMRWEGGIVNWLYLDNRRVNGVPAPLPTIGAGCATSLQECLTLPFVVGDRPAAIHEIADDFTNIKQAPFDFAADFYQKYTVIRLPDDACIALCRSRAMAFKADLERVFPAFDTWPLTCQAGALDLLYGLGDVKFEATYPLFIGAGHQSPPNFKEMAAQSGSNENDKAYDLRNQARKLLFLQAVNP
jgi:hypothetical protein